MKYLIMKNKWLILAAVGCGTFMSTLDASIVNVALPSITQYFHTGLATSRWVVIAYLFSITGLLLFFGKIADIIGRKPVFNLGYVIFTIGSFLCGISANITQLIISRSIQGVGAAMIMSNGPAVITTTFPANERGKALGTLAMVVSAGLALGPTLGGFFVRFIGWQSIFFVNLPFGIIGAILVSKYIPSTIGHDIENPTEFEKITEREKKLPFAVRLQLTFNKMKNFDWVGAVFWLIIQIGYSLAIDRENILGMSGPFQRLLTFAASGLFVLFIIWEWGNQNPILDLALFRSKVFLASNFSALFNFIAISSITLLMPFYYQNVRGLPPHKVGAYLTIIPASIFFVAPISGRLSDKYGSRLLTTVGMILICFTMAALAHPHSAITNPNVATTIPYLIAIGVGIGLFQSPNNNAIMGAVSKEHLGVASALLATIRNFGLVTGAGLGTSLLMYFYNIKTIEAGVGAIPSENFVSSLRLTFLSLAMVCTIGIFSSLVKDLKNDN